LEEDREGDKDKVEDMLGMGMMDKVFVVVVGIQGVVVVEEVVVDMGAVGRVLGIEVVVGVDMGVVVEEGRGGGQDGGGGQQSSLRTKPPDPSRSMEAELDACIDTSSRRQGLSYLLLFLQGSLLCFFCAGCDCLTEPHAGRVMSAEKKSRYQKGVILD